MVEALRFPLVIGCCAWHSGSSSRVTCQKLIFCRYRCWYRWTGTTGPSGHFWMVSRQGHEGIEVSFVTSQRPSSSPASKCWLNVGSARSFSLFESAKDSCQFLFILRFFFIDFVKYSAKSLLLAFPEFWHFRFFSSDFIFNRQSLLACTIPNLQVALLISLVSTFWVVLSGFWQNWCHCWHWEKLLRCFTGRPETWAAIVCRVQRCEEGARETLAVLPRRPAKGWDFCSANARRFCSFHVSTFAFVKAGCHSNRDVKQKPIPKMTTAVTAVWIFMDFTQLLNHQAAEENFDHIDVQCARWMICVNLLSWFCETEVEELLVDDRVILKTLKLHEAWNMFFCNLTWADCVWSCWISTAQEPIQSHISRVHFWEPPLWRTVGFATFFLVEISGFFRADINIFNSLLAKQPLKSQAVAFPSCFVELEHILFFGDQVFMEALKFESLLLQIVKGNLSWHGLVDQVFKLFNPPVFIVQQRLYSCQGK